MFTRRILIVDDEVSLARMLKLNLENRASYETHVANSGRDGLAAARELRPDLILLDLVMPDMDGTEVANRLSEEESTRGIRIIFLTALVDRAKVEAKGGVLGGRAFIAKPAEALEVIAAIEKQFSNPAASTRGLPLPRG